MRDTADRAADRLRAERSRGERSEEIGCLESESGNYALCPLSAIDIDQSREVNEARVTGQEWIHSDTVIDVVEVA